MKGDDAFAVKDPTVFFSNALFRWINIIVLLKIIALQL